MEIQRLLRAMAQFHASDLHLQADRPPAVRIDGNLTALDIPALSAESVADLVRLLADDCLMEKIERERSADFTYFDPEIARFRVNAFYERGRLCASLRLIPLEILSLDQLNLPPIVQDITQAERGLVLVTGTTGSGKSTTLAAMIDYLNAHRSLRIVTIEDPIEFVHTSKNSLVAHREVGTDTHGFAEALRGVLRQDPDVILVGELRDVETIRNVLQATDTGHLVYSTMHTTNAAQTVQRLISMFPPNERELLLTQLAENLEAVISQRFAHARKGGRVPVLEILRNSPVIGKIIRENRVSALPQAMANRDQGMQLFDQHLPELYNARVIGGTETLRLSTNTEAVALAMRGITSADLSDGLERKRRILSK